MKLILVIFLFVIVFFSYYFFSKVFFDFDDIEIAKIENMIEKKEYDLLSEYLSLKLQKHRDNGAIYYYMGKVFYLKKDYRRALKYLDISIDLGFPLIQSYNLKAVIYGDVYADYIKQKEFAQKSIELDPTDFEGYLIRARAWFKLGDYDLALRDFQTAFDIEKDDNILLEKAVTLLKLGRFKDAIFVLYDLNNKYKNNETVMFYLFGAYKGIGYYNNAYYLISNLYNTYKKNIYLKEKAILLFDMGDYEYSFSEFDKYLKLTKPDESDIRFYSAVSSKIKRFDNK